MAGRLGGSIASDVISGLGDVFSRAQDRATARNNALMGLSDPLSTARAPGPSTTSMGGGPFGTGPITNVNGMALPNPRATGGQVGQSPNTGALENQAKNGGLLGGVANINGMPISQAPNPVYQPPGGGANQTNSVYKPGSTPITNINGAPVGQAGFAQPSQPVGGIERFSGRSGESGNQQVWYRDINTDYGVSPVPLYPGQPPLPGPQITPPPTANKPLLWNDSLGAPITNINGQPTVPLSGMPNSMNQTPPSPPYHTGDLTAPQFPGHAGDLSAPSTQTGTPMPTPGTPGAPVPSPGLGGVVGQGPASNPVPATASPAPPARSGPVAIPDPRAGMPTYPASTSPSPRPPMPVPPWVYQNQQIQIPANILAGNPNLAQFAPGGVVDTSGNMGPIWGPIAKGQLPGGLAGQMFQGTIDPRTGQPLGAGGASPNQQSAPGPAAPITAGGVPITNVNGMPLPNQPANPAQPAVPGAPPAAPPTTAAPPTAVPSARDIVMSRINKTGMPGQPAVPATSAPTTDATRGPITSVNGAPLPGGTTTAPAAPAQPGSTGQSGVWDPQGTIQGAPQNNGGSWDAINQYDPLIAKWTQQMGRPDLAPVLKGIIAVETGGQNIQGGEPGSTGLMQIMPQYWTDTANKLGVDLNTPEGQIAVATAILAGTSGHGDQGSWQANFQTYYFPHDDSNGTTQAGYTQWLQSMYDQGQSAGGPLPKTVSQPPGSPAGGTTPFNITATPVQAPNGKMTAQNPDYSWTNSIVAGSSDATQQNNYGFDAASGCPGCYNDYQQSEWGDPNAHPGVDIPATPGSAITVPVSGTITCDRTYGQGAPDAGDGTGCNAFRDDNGGAGQLTERLGNGDLIIFGHASGSNVQIGQQVQAGQQIGTSGVGNGGGHVHLEVRHYDQQTGQWTIVDPTLYFSGYYGAVY